MPPLFPPPPEKAQHCDKCRKEISRGDGVSIWYDGDNKETRVLCWACDPELLPSAAVI